MKKKKSKVAYTRGPYKKAPNGLQTKTRVELVRIGTPLAMRLCSLNVSLKIIAKELRVHYGVLRLWILTGVAPNSEKAELLERIIAAKSAEFEANSKVSG